MQSAVHNLNIYTPWLHLSFWRINTNKSIRTKINRVYYTRLDGKLCRPFAYPDKKNIQRRRRFSQHGGFESVLDSMHAAIMAGQWTTHARARVRGETKARLCCELIASVPSSFSEREREREP